MSNICQKFKTDDKQGCLFPGHALLKIQLLLLNMALWSSSLNEPKTDIKEFEISSQSWNEMHLPATLTARQELGRPASKEQTGHRHQDIHEGWINGNM